jgi:hypothetical protein
MEDCAAPARGDCVTYGGKRMVEMLPDDAPTERRWTGRDDNNANFYGKIPLIESIVTLTLSWKRDTNANPVVVGRLRLNMEQLVEAGYARKVTGAYILRFQRTGNQVQIAVNRGQRALPLPTVLQGYYA